MRANVVYTDADVAALRTRVLQGIEVFRREMEAENPSFVISARQAFVDEGQRKRSVWEWPVEFCRRELERLSKALRDSVLLCGKKISRIDDIVEMELWRRLSAIESKKIKDRMEVIKKRIEFQNKPSGNTLATIEIEKASSYPLWKLLDAKPQQRIQCPLHKGQDRNFLLSNRGPGHCFVCNRTINAITWLREFKGMNFYDAVKALQ